MRDVETLNSIWKSTLKSTQSEQNVTRKCGEGEEYTSENRVIKIEIEINIM